MEKILFKRLNGNKLPLPAYETTGSAGFDIKANLAKSIDLAPGKWKLIPSGFSVQIPENYELQVRPRSGLSLKHGITVLNGPGTIDSDYRGEVCVILINLGDKVFKIQHGDRIAQLVMQRVMQPELVEALELSESSRGEGGFGSTGKR